MSAARCLRSSRWAKPRGWRRIPDPECYNAKTRRSVVRRAEVRWPFTSRRVHRFFSYRAVVAETLNFEKASGGLEADRPHRGRNTQPHAEVKVARVVEGRLRADADLGPSENPFEVLLDAGVLVTDVQGGDHPQGQDPSARKAQPSLPHITVEDQLHLVGAAEVEVWPLLFFSARA